MRRQSRCVALFCRLDRRRQRRRVGPGAYGIRTRDLLNAIEALYQLS
jgi:hypothetical protein